MKIGFRGLLAIAITVLSVTANGQAPEAGTAAEVEALEPAISSQTLSSMDSSGTSAVGATAPASASLGETSQATSSRGVLDEIELERTEITGNQELPRVLHIVPWQKAAIGDLLGRPESTALEDVLAPVDRPEFIRQVDYYGDLHGEEDE